MSEAKRERNRRYRANLSPEKRSEMRAKALARYRALPAEKRAEKTAKERARYRAEPEFRDRVFSRQMLYSYGLTVADIRGMRVAQGDRCAICERRFTATPHVDHFHDPALGYEGQKNGKRTRWRWNPGVTNEQKRSTVRWLACDACNSALGYFDDDTRIMRKAAAKLDAWFRRQGLTLRDARAGQQSLFGEAP